MLVFENDSLEEKLNETMIQKSIMMKYKEIVKNALTVRCKRCAKEYKPVVFKAHLTGRCEKGKENRDGNGNNEVKKGRPGEEVKVLSVGETGSFEIEIGM